jgi:serine/threonine-protein kinase
MNRSLVALSGILLYSAAAFANPPDRLQQAIREAIDLGSDPTTIAKYAKAYPKVPADDASPEEWRAFRAELNQFYAIVKEDPEALSAFNDIQQGLHLPQEFNTPQTPQPQTEVPPRNRPTSVGDLRRQDDIPDKLIQRWELSRIQAQRGDGRPKPQVDFGTLNFVRGNSQEALHYLGRGIEYGDHSAPTVTLYGRAAADAGDYNLAYEAGQAALQQDPDYADAKALVLLAKGKTSTISLPDALAKVGLAKPDAISQNSGAAGEAGSASPFGAGDAARQAAAMQSASGVDPVEQQRRAELAAAAARQQVVPPTKIQQSAAVTKEAAHSLQIGDYPGAYTRATEAIALNNQNAQAWNYRAMAATNMQRYSDAVYDASYSINLEAQQAPPWVTRSWAFAKEKKYKEAEQDARVALEKAPENAYAYHDLAYALAGQGRREEALAALQAAAAQDARFAPKYQKALQLAQNEDMTLLFADAPQASAGAASAAAPASAPPAPSRSRRFLRLFLLSISGGLIFALAVLHVVSASWREKVNATIRRVLSKSEAAPAPALPATADARVAADGFWAQYDKVGDLGAGGMGLVYEAVDKSLDRRVAVKKMRDEIRIDPAERQRFIQEARTVAALHHPNIVDIYNIVDDGQDVYLVFEYVPGKTLSQRLEDSPLSFAEARGVLSGVCSAVEYAHKQKIIHRDLKPSNIMIREDGAVKVMDFGVARQAKDAMTKMSMTNTVVGTPPYMAPEQEQGTVRMESDVFALGVVLYESLCGELPFQGVGAGMLLNKINGKHEPLSKRTAQPLPPGLDEVMAKALCPDPDKRYRTPAELMAALDALPVPSVA